MSATWTDPAAEAVARLVAVRTGFTYAQQYPAKTEESIRRSMAAQGVASVSEYLALLERTPQAMEQLMDELTIRETYFFREPRHFEFIRDQILPQLREARGHEHVLRAWSAGCASGEEAYSLAILMAQSGLSDAASVLGTDISQAALTTARGGRYRDWSLRGAGSKFMSSWFRAAGPAWELIEPIRRKVRFAYLNLSLDAWPSHVSGTLGMDLILCRNVLIYFDAWTVEQVARRLCASLAPGGWLVTASSDPTLGRNAGLEPHVTEYGVFYQRPVVEQRPLLHDAHESPAPPIKPRRAARQQPARKVRRPLETPEPASAPLAVGDRARAALLAGEYRRVLELIPDLRGEADACRLRVDALANHRGPEAASDAAEEALRHHPLSTALHFRHAVLLSSLGRLKDSEQALRRVIYLDRRLAVAHFALGALHWRGRRLEAARRCYRTAERICRASPPDVELPLADGQSAGSLAAAAARHLSALGGQEEAIPA